MGKRLRQWFGAITRWLWDGRRGLVLLLVVIGIVFVAQLITIDWDDGFRCAGLALQIVGVITVAIGLRNRRQTFQKPGLSRLFFQWLAKFPRYAAKPHIRSGGSGVSISVSASGGGFGWHNIPENAPVEERLAVLQRNLCSVKQLALDAGRQTQMEAAKLTSMLKAESRKLEESFQVFGAKLESVGAGNLYLEEAGVYFIIFGIVFGNAPNEMAMLVRWFQ